MCFFDQHRFACGDWKWGHFRQHCSKDYRIGETCGMKLIMQTIPVHQKCKLCEKIDTKMRRRAAEVDRIHRWNREGHKFRASIDKSMETIRGLDSEIYELGCERNRRLQGIGALTAHADFTGGNESSPTDFQIVLKEDLSFALPLTFENVLNPATVMAIPDTGADVNIMSSDLAAHMGLEVKESEQLSLRLPNGTELNCSSFVKATLRFAKGGASPYKPLQCIIHVVRNLVSPLMMCRDFLKQTHTLTRYPERLIKTTCSFLRIPRIRTIGTMQERLQCSLDGANTEALADSGSDVDVISLRYAIQRGFHIERQERWLMLADGTFSRSCGIVRAQLAVGFGVRKFAKDDRVAISESADEHSASSETVSVAKDSRAKYSDTIQANREENSLVQAGNTRRVIETQLYVSEDVEIDFIVGIGSLVALEVYTSQTHCLVTRERRADDATYLNRIILLPGLEGKFRQIVRAWLAKAKNSERRAPVPIDQIMDEEDQQENARKESARLRISRLEGEEKAKAGVEETERRIEFEQYRAFIVKAVASMNTRA